MRAPTNPLILPYAGISPLLATPPLHAGEGAAVLGRVTLGRNAWLGDYSVVRADGEVVQAGDDFYLGARSTLHIAHEEFFCIVGDRVTVGENCCVHACRVGSDVIVDDDVVILDGSVVEDNVLFETGTTVYPGKHIPGGYIYAGSPARPVQPLQPRELEDRREKILRKRESGLTTARSRPASGSQIDPSVFIASTVSIKGRLDAAPLASVWFSNDFSAGRTTISIGEKTNVQDNTIIRCTGTGVTIGRETTVGHNVMLDDCSIGNRSLIGIGAVVAKGTIVQDHVLLAAHAHTVPGQLLERGCLYAGNPAKKLGPLDDGKRSMIAFIVAGYCHYAKDFAMAERDLVATKYASSVR